MTREERAAYYRIYRAKNKEKVSQINKKYRDNNKDKIKTLQKQWKENNPEYSKEYKANQKDGYHRVYLLEDYNYVGVTENIKHRFSQHKYKHNRDCSNHRVLYKTKDRSEALELEELLHDIGYEGRKEKTKI